MVELIVGQTYQTKELVKELGISDSLWKRKKNEYLNSLSQAYEYEVSYKGRAVLYTITKQIADFKKPENKRSREKNMEVIRKFIIEVIEEDNLQTAANMGRRAFESFTEGITTEVAKLGLTEGTAKEYIRLKMREMFGRNVGESGTDGFISEKVWCHLEKEYNTYIEMTDAQIADYYNMVQTIRSDFKKDDVCLYEDYENGLITKEEYQEALCDFNCMFFKTVKSSFKEKYGFTPIKVPRYELNAWKDKEKEYEEINVD